MCIVFISTAEDGMKLQTSICNRHVSVYIYIYIYIYIGNVYFVRFSRHTICFKQLAPQVARATKTRMLADERITDITWLCRRFTISVLEKSYTFVFYHELNLLGVISLSHPLEHL